MKTAKFESCEDKLVVDDKYNIANIQTKTSVICDGSIYKNLVVNEDVFEKENLKIPPLAAAVVGISNTDAPLPNNTRFHNIWSNVDAHQSYIGAKPTCYLILGKSGLGAFTIGESLAKKLSCIHLCPENLIRDELAQESLTGKCMDFNMKQNKVVRFDHLLKMLKQKLQSPAVAHRGYLISGFPMVVNSMKEHYIFRSAYSEDAIAICCDIIDEIVKTASIEKKVLDMYEFEEEEQVDSEKEETEMNEEDQELLIEVEKFVLNTCHEIFKWKKTYIDTKHKVILSQLKEILNLPMKPDIIILINCPDPDIVTLRKNKYFLPFNNKFVHMNFNKISDNEIRWPVPYKSLNDYIAPIETPVQRSKYACRLPQDFEKNVNQQMCNYRNHLQSYIEKQLKNYKSECILRVDGRVSINDMVHNVVVRLNLLRINPAVIPEPFDLESAPEEMEEFWDMVESRNVIESDDTTFSRHASPWYDRCPVELKYRRHVKGKLKLAVKFLNHVYLLSTLENLNKFCKNPRPYLDIKYLEPTCRIVVTGTKSAGKSMISQCLTWLFECPIIEFDVIVPNVLSKRLEERRKKMFPLLINIIRENRINAWKQAENERKEALSKWLSDSVKKLLDYQNMLEDINDDYDDSDDDSYDDDSDSYDPVKEKQKAKIFHKIRKQFQSMHITTEEQLGDFIKNENKLVEYAPIDIKESLPRPEDPVYGDPDVEDVIDEQMEGYEETEEDTNLSEDVISDICNKIHEWDSKVIADTNGEQKYSKWVIDGFPLFEEYWALLIEKKLFPDCVIAIVEDRDIDVGLKKHYDNINNSVKKHLERVSEADDPFIKIKLMQSKPPPDIHLDMKIIVNDLIKVVFAKIISHIPRVTLPDEPDVAETEELELDIEANEAYEEARSAWEKTKDTLNEKDIQFVQISLKGKSDIQVVEECLLKLRQVHYMPCKILEDEREENENALQDWKNGSQKFGDTGPYCPVTFKNFNVLHFGKTEFSLKYDGKLYRFINEDCLNEFENNPNKYIAYNIPIKKLPPIRICIAGSKGSGKTTLSKFIAKEFGLMHVDYSCIINDYLLPKHLKKVGIKYESVYEKRDSSFSLEEDEPELGDAEENTDPIEELRQMVFDYYENGQPMAPEYTRKLIQHIWFDKPFCETGFVLDGFPRIPEEVEEMVGTNCIPDLVVHVDTTTEECVNRVLLETMELWQQQLATAQEIANDKLVDLKKEWSEFIDKIVSCKLIIDELISEMLAKCRIDIESHDYEGETELMEEEHFPDKAKEEFEFDVETVLPPADPEEIIRKLALKIYPEPKGRTEWESEEEAREVIFSRLESIVEVDMENLEGLEEALTENRIKYMKITGVGPKDKIKRKILHSLNFISNRNESFFEQTYVIPLDRAQTILSEGFLLYSKFGRMCPVHIYYDPSTIFNPFSNTQINKSHPVIHRSFIYFICSEDHLQKFRSNPLKYIASKNIEGYEPFPLRITLIGPPKSGKSILAARICKKLGLLPMSKGTLVRHILEYLHWTELAIKMKQKLDAGKPIDNPAIVEAAFYTFNHYRPFTNGVLFDGFPRVNYGVSDSSRLGIFPQVVFVLECSEEKIFNNLKNDVHLDILKYKPPYSQPFIKNRIENWKRMSPLARDLIENDYNNLEIINANGSIWNCMNQINNHISEMMKNIHKYLSNFKENIVSLASVPMSYPEFLENMTQFKDLCPVCLYTGKFRHSYHRLDRKGMVQYKGFLYWICADHLERVLKYPQRYLDNNSTIDIPEIPARVKFINIDLIYENGVCVVTYAENLPALVFKKGEKEFAITFKKKTYLFCSLTCLEKFMQRPHLYYDIVIFKDLNNIPKIELKSLPRLGYLEQTLGNIITEACCYVNAVRPKYPGLDINTSALILIALYLKIHDPANDNTTRTLYTSVLKKFEARCKMLLNFGLFLRSVDNPFTQYPMCCPP